MMNRILRLVLLTTIALAIPAHAASFDCSKAASKIEKMICQDEELSRLDRQLGEKFKAAIRLSAQPDQLKNAQRSWLGNMRNPCADKPCLVAAYQLRMQELDLIPSANHPSDAASSATTADQPPETDNSRTMPHDELLDGQWVTQKAKTEQFSFRVAITRSSESSDSSVTATAIQVIDRKTGKTVQTIREVSSDETATPPEQLLEVVDANFDHHPDITLFGQSGGAGPNNTDNYFLFNPQSGLFEFNALLSGLPQVQIDTRHQAITTSSRGGCCSHSSQVYRFISGTLTLVDESSESLSDDGKWLETSTGKLSGGKMVYRTSKKKAPKDY